MVVAIIVKHLDCNISKSCHKRYIPTTQDLHLMSLKSSRYVKDRLTRYSSSSIWNAFGIYKSKQKQLTYLNKLFCEQQN